MKKTLLLLAALTLSPALYAQDYHVVLWDNATAPTSNGLTGEEIQPKPGQWSNTQKAEMWIYKAGDNATGQALVFFPGGGYSTLSVGNGHKEAKWFAENGVTAAVVKYRLPNGHSEVPRNDADEALRLTPPRIMSLEQCLEFISDDELVEVTPQSVRLRKRLLSATDRKKAKKN